MEWSQHTNYKVPVQMINSTLHNATLRDTTASMRVYQTHNVTLDRQLTILLLSKLLLYIEEHINGDNIVRYF